MKSLPDQFLILTHEGLSKVSLSFEQVQNIDTLLSRFTAEKLVLIPRVATHPFGYQHAANWTSVSPKSWAVLELTQGKIVLSTLYASVSGEDGEWAYPCFAPSENSFPLRCLFDFQVWHQAGLRMFLALNMPQAAAHFWVYYEGQIYKPPFGNIFESTSQL